jgi:hypothetical protein
MLEAAKIKAPVMKAAKTSRAAVPAIEIAPAQAARSARLGSSGGFVLLLVMSLLGGLLTLTAKGGLGRWESILGSSERAIGVIFLAQISAAIVCFCFLVRWLRS